MSFPGFANKGENYDMCLIKGKMFPIRPEFKSILECELQTQAILLIQGRRETDPTSDDSEFEPRHLQSFFLVLIDKSQQFMTHHQITTRKFEILSLLFSP